MSVFLWITATVVVAALAAVTWFLAACLEAYAPRAREDSDLYRTDDDEEC